MISNLHFLLLPEGLLSADVWVQEGEAPSPAPEPAGEGLPAPYTLTVTPPSWQGGNAGEDASLAACCRDSLALLWEQGCRSAIFPSLAAKSGYPLRRASRIVLTELMAFLQAHPQMDLILAFEDEAHYRMYQFNYNMWFEGTHPDGDLH